MSRIDELYQIFTDSAAHPKRQLDQYKADGKKVIGILPYYVPEELVLAAGMVPMGLWGSNSKNVALAKEYCATFYCTIAQLGLEMLLDGTLDQLDGIITPTICDTLRPMSQNYRVAMEGKLPCIFLAHPQNRRPEYGIQFAVDQYTHIKEELEKISGTEITNQALTQAIQVYNASRRARRTFSKLAGKHGVSAVKRSAIFRSAWFMEKEQHTTLLNELNTLLAETPVVTGKGKVVTTGIICDNPKLLQILDDNNLVIVDDDVAQESRMIRVDVLEIDEPLRALAEQFSRQRNDVLLYDPHSSSNLRGEFVADLAKDQGAGVLLFMQQFCDPEEMEYPSLKQALDQAGVAHIRLGIDQQMRDFGQASTAIQAFADML